jgi:hypothetical protein
LLTGVVTFTPPAHCPANSKSANALLIEWALPVDRTEGKLSKFLQLALKLFDVLLTLLRALTQRLDSRRLLPVDRPRKRQQSAPLMMMATLMMMMVVVMLMMFRPMMMVLMVGTQRIQNSFQESRIKNALVGLLPAIVEGLADFLPRILQTVFCPFQGRLAGLQQIVPDSEKVLKLIDE